MNLTLNKIEMKEDFKDYLKNAKNDFKEVIVKYNYTDHKELHVAFDSFLLAYEQAENKAINFTDSYTQFNASLKVGDEVWYDSDKLAKVIEVINNDLVDIQYGNQIFTTRICELELAPKSV